MPASPCVAALPCDYLATALLAATMWVAQLRCLVSGLDASQTPAETWIVLDPAGFSES